MLNEVYIDRFIDSPKDLNHAVVVIGYTTGVDMNDCNNTDNYSTCRHTVFGDCSTKATPFSRPRIERRDMRQMSWDMNLIIDLDNELGENLPLFKSKFKFKKSINILIKLHFLEQQNF